MEFLDRGKGNPLVLIHGFPLDGRIWEGQLELLAKSGRVLVPDLPGFGRTPPAPMASMEAYAREILALMDGLGLRRFAVAGHSMGGYVALALQRLAPARLSGLALVSSRATADTEEGRKAREVVARRVEAEGVGFLAETAAGRMFGPAPGEALLKRVQGIMGSQSAAGVAAAARAMGTRPEARLQLRSISCPALVIAGRHDQIVPAAESEGMAAAIRQARLVWAEGSGHLPMLEEPERVAKELAAFNRET